MKKQEIHTLLETHNLKKTQGIQKILSLFLNTEKPLAAEDIYKKTKKDINESTVYRSLKRLLEKGIIKEIYLSAEKKYYELASRKHHHHLVCTSCNHIKDIPCIPNIPKIVNLKKHGFHSINNHSFEVFGICNKCK